MATSPSATNGTSPVHTADGSPTEGGVKGRPWWQALSNDGSLLRVGLWRDAPARLAPETTSFRSAPAVAVGAPHVALGDLRLDLPQGSDFTHELGDLCVLRLSRPMVEVKAPDVLLTTIDAGVLEEVRGDPVPIRLSLPRDAICDSKLVLLLVRDVPGPAAVATPRLPPIARSLEAVESFERLDLVACRAALHD